MKRRLTKRAIFLVLGVLGVILALSIAVYRQVAIARKETEWFVTDNRLRMIWSAHQIAADDSKGSYPPHAAALLVRNYATPQVFLDARGVEGSVLTVGDLDLTVLFQSSEDIYQWREYIDIDQLDNAIAATGNDSVSFYRFGDFWLMRLPRATNSGKVIFAWRIPESDGARLVIFDNGDMATLSGGAWWPALQEDALERERLGLPLIDPAPP